jgi:threonine dehydrogenase-like Zn-dependent dehydrogenase
LGLGLVGQLALQLARWAGGTPIVGLSRSNAFHAAALAGGADRVIELGRDPDAEPEFQADVVLEATGSAAGISTALRCARAGGRVILMGSSRGITAGVDFERDVSTRGLSIIGAHISSVAPRESSNRRWTRRDEAELFLDLVARGLVDPRPLISRRASPADANRVYDDLVAQKTAMLGILFDWKTLRRRQD